MWCHCIIALPKSLESSMCIAITEKWIHKQIYDIYYILYILHIIYIYIYIYIYWYNGTLIYMFNNKNVSLKPWYYELVIKKKIEIKKMKEIESFLSNLFFCWVKILFI